MCLYLYCFLLTYKNDSVSILPSFSAPTRTLLNMPSHSRSPQQNWQTFQTLQALKVKHSQNYIGKQECRQSMLLNMKNKARWAVCCCIFFSPPGFVYVYSSVSLSLSFSSCMYTSVALSPFFSQCVCICISVFQGAVCQVPQAVQGRGEGSSGGEWGAEQWREAHPKPEGRVCLGLPSNAAERFVCGGYNIWIT